jgi:hypothetical protein
MTIIVLSLTILQIRLKSLSITEFEGTNYITIFRELEIQYNKLDNSKINAINEKERPTREDFEILKTSIESADDTCQTFNSGAQGNQFMQELYKKTTKLKMIEELTLIVTQFESEMDRYIRNCAIEKEYFVNITTINNILDDDTNLNILTGVLNGSISCESPSLQTITSSTKNIYNSYAKVRTYTDNLTSTYNSSALKLTESDEVIAKLSDENTKLGNDTQKIMQDLQYLRSKKSTESQEIAILLRDLKEDYQALTTLETSTFYDAQNQTFQGSKVISISLDDKNTWYAFQDQTEFFQFLKLLNNSNSEVSLIQNKSLDIISKKNSIVKINASEISKTFMIDLITQNIVNNNAQINDLNNEQNEIKPKIDKYNEYVKQLRETDTELRKNIASMTSAIDQCKKYGIERINTLRSKTDNLNEDIKTEMKRKYSEEFSDKDYLVIQNPDSANNLDVADLLKIIDDYSKFESRFTNCRQSDSLDIITGSEVKESTTIKGISNFSIVSEPVNNIDKSLETINNKYSISQPIAQIDVNHYSNYVNQSFIDNRNQYSSSENNTFVFNLYPNNIWTQEIASMEETHKVYNCNNSSWEEISEQKVMVLQYGECKSTSVEPIPIEYSPDKGEVNQIVMSEINKYIQTQQIKVKGECKTY